MNGVLQLICRSHVQKSGKPEQEKLKNKLFILLRVQYSPLPPPPPPTGWDAGPTNQFYYCKSVFLDI